MRVLGLHRKMLQLRSDVLSAAKGAIGSRASDCLDNIHQNLEFGSSLVGEIGDLVDISTDMQLAADEATVNQKLAEQIRYSRDQVGNIRESINLYAGYCSNDSLVTEKAREALKMFSEFDVILDSLQSKISRMGQVTNRQ
jgi:hypothetical protein